jgi:hypothetical protein
MGPLAVLPHALREKKAYQQDLNQRNILEHEVWQQTFCYEDVVTH